MSEFDKLCQLLEDLNVNLATKASNAKIDKLMEEIKAKDQTIEPLTNIVGPLESNIDVMQNTIRVLV